MCTSRSSADGTSMHRTEFRAAVPTSLMAASKISCWSAREIVTPPSERAAASSSRSFTISRNMEERVTKAVLPRQSRTDPDAPAAYLRREVDCQRAGGLLRAWSNVLAHSSEILPIPNSLCRNSFSSFNMKLWPCACPGCLSKSKSAPMFSISCHVSRLRLRRSSWSFACCWALSTVTKTLLMVYAQEGEAFGP